MQTATVYCFVSRNVANPELARSVGKKATMETIAGMNGEIIPGTEEEVPIEALNADGFYQRAATGWGELTSS